MSKPSQDSTQIGEVGLRAFLNLAEVWELSIAEQTKILGFEDCSAFEAMKTRTLGFENAPISIDILTRIGSILSIYSSLVNLLSHERSAGWLRSPNSGSIFNGGSALDLMTGGSLEDLDSVAKYLLAQLYG